jgi:hypothetical protein
MRALQQFARERNGRRHHRDMADLDMGPRRIPAASPERVAAMREQHARPCGASSASLNAMPVTVSA